MAPNQLAIREATCAIKANHLLNLFNGELAVKLSFESRDVRAICESQVKAERIYGIEAARQVRGFLADLDSAETLEEIPPEVLWVSNDTAFEGFEAMPTEGILLRMRANHVGNSRLPAQQSDRAAVRRLKILEIKKIEAGRG